VHKNDVKKFMGAIDSRKKYSGKHWFSVGGCDHCYEKKKDLYYFMNGNDPVFLCEDCLDQLLAKK